MTSSTHALSSRLDELERHYEEICAHMGHANWNNYSREGPADLDAARRAFFALFSDDSLLESLRDPQATESRDSVWRRRIETWRRCVLGGRLEGDPEIAPLENELEKRITSFPFELEGTLTPRSELQRRLAEEQSQDRRRDLWRVMHQLHRAMVSDLRRLVALRNRRAQEAGFDHFYAFSLHLQDIDEAWLVSVLEELETTTRDPYQSFLAASKETLKLGSLGPWDLRRAARELISLPNELFPPDTVFECVRRSHRQIGFAVDTLPIREVLLDIPYGGLSLAIRIPTDSRLLVNPTAGHRLYHTAFHEYGHSVQAASTRIEHPILKGYEWIPGAQCPAFSEGVAEVHGELTRHPVWLSETMEIPLVQIERHQSEGRYAEIVRLRNLLASFSFEYEMYRRPDQDLDELERETSRRILLVEVDEDEPARWAADTWFTAYPCYYQSYVLASMIAEQVHEALAGELGPRYPTSPEVATWLVNHLYAAGELVPWPDRLRRATGRPLDSSAYLRRVAPRASLRE